MLALAVQAGQPMTADGDTPTGSRVVSRPGASFLLL